MTAHELLLTISEIEEKKIRAEAGPIKDDIETIKTEQKRINLIIKNVIRADVGLLAQNYMPAAKKYAKAAVLIL